MKNYRDYREKKALMNRLFIIIPAVIATLVILGMLLHSVDQGSGGAAEANTAEEDEDVKVIGGKKYTPKDGIKTYLFIGNDNSEEREETGTVLGGGQCDTIELLVYDRNHDTYNRLSLNRDTMTEIESFDSEGKSLGTSTAQLSLAYAQGGGGESSCENTVNAVSALLYGQKIDEYLSLDIDGIAPINQAVGGVTVTIEDDFSKADPSLVQGETLTLTDEQALTFVQGRKNVADGSNENRVKRQNTYIAALKEQLISRCSEDSRFASDFFEVLEPYMTTSFTAKQFSRLANTLVTCEEGEHYTPEGTSQVGRFNYNEFTIDQENLEEIVTALFYEPAD